MARIMTNMRFSSLAIAAVLLIVLSVPLVDAKRTQCKTRFSKRTSSDYCTKFGTAQHATMEVEVRSRLANSASLTPSVKAAEHVKLELGVFRD